REGAELRVEVVVGAREQEIRQPEREAIDEHRSIGGQGSERGGERERGLDRRPRRAALTLVSSDASLHLVIAGSTRGDVDLLRRSRLGAMQGVAGLPASNAAGDEELHGAQGRTVAYRGAARPSLVRGMGLRLTPRGEAETIAGCLDSRASSSLPSRRSTASSTSRLGLGMRN